MNIGTIPTFKNDAPSRSVEIHLLDFQGDLYGNYLIADVLRYLRPEKRFSSPEDLLLQVRNDVETFRRWIEQENPSP